MTWREIYDAVDNERRNRYTTKAEVLKMIAELVWLHGYNDADIVYPEDCMVVAMEMQEAMFSWYDPTIEEYNEILSRLGTNRYSGKHIIKERYLS